MHKKWRKNQSGEAILMTTIVLLIMVVIVEACATAASTQLNMAYMRRNDSNTYYIAKSGVAKGVEMLNKSIQAEMPNIIEEVRATFIEPLTDLERVRNFAAGGGNAHSFTDFYYCSEGNCTQSGHEFSCLWYVGERIEIHPLLLGEFVAEEIEQFVIDEYIDITPGSNPITYSYIVDGDQDGTDTQVTLTFETDDDPTTNTGYIVKSTAQRTDGSSMHTVEGLVDIDVPYSYGNMLNEKYEWVYNPAEILDSAITVFSDIVVTDEAELTVLGDIRVNGSTATTTTQSNGNMILLDAPDTDESGGVIASNGGRITVRKAGGTNTGNIYTLNNVLTTHGWEPNNSYTNTLLANYTRPIKSSISVQGDVIASTVSIVDDFYPEGYNKNPMDGDRVVQGNMINVTGNVFVDNDVKIDPYVEDSKINVNGSIFGVSDGTLGDIYDLRVPNGTGGLVNVQSKDPNMSSAILSRGQDDTLIKAKGIYVNGQPYIDLGKGIPAALLESIGEPFQEVHAFPGYNEIPPDPAGNDAYLDPDQNYLYEYIELDKVEISNRNRIYTPDTYVSAVVGNNQPSINKYSNNHLTSKPVALDFFYRGGSNVTLKKLTGSNNYNTYNTLMTNTDPFYTGSAAYASVPGLYSREFTERMNTSLTSKYQGLRGYMTAKRGVFYTTFDSATERLLTANFNDLVDLRKIENMGSWGIENPIKVVSGGTIDVSDFYASVDEVMTRPYPSIIINTGGDLKIKGNNNQKLEAIIISAGNVELEGQFTIEGSIVVGGTHHTSRDDIMLGNNVGLLLSGRGTDVTIIQNPDILLETTFNDPSVFRKILDALKITQFTNSYGGNVTNLAVALGPYHSDRITYTQGRVKLSNESLLKLDTGQINVTIEHIKEVND